MKHLLSINDLSNDEIFILLDMAQQLVDNGNYHIHTQSLTGRTIVNMFFEPSTRTRCSFEIAAKRLDTDVINFEAGASSTIKGESLLDTIHTLEAMHTDVFVIRHTEDNICREIVENLHSNAAVINAGTGVSDHPTQALLDLLTMQQCKGDISKLSIAIAGDVKHSRVARSNLQALTKLGVQDLRIIGPENFISDDIKQYTSQIYHNMDEGLKDLDIIMMLRIQKERMDSQQFPNVEAYFQQYGLSEKRLQLLKPDAIVMHPAPINRGIEIASSVADGKQSVINLQIANGVAMRMAIIKSLLSM